MSSLKPSAESIEPGLRKFIEDTFLFDFGTDAEPETDLFESDLIDSFGFIQLVQYLEQTFGISIDEEELASPDIVSLRGIVDMVCRLMSEKEA